MSEPAPVPALRAEGLVKGYRTPAGYVSVLRGLDATVGSGEMLAITGASGVGKSTLLHVLGTLDPPESGSLAVAGRSVLDLDEDRLRRYRNETLGFVFQAYHLLPEFSALASRSQSGSTLFLRGLLPPDQLARLGAAPVRVASHLRLLGLPRCRGSATDRAQSTASVAPWVGNRRPVFVREPVGRTPDRWRRNWDQPTREGGVNWYSLAPRIAEASDWPSAQLSNSSGRCP